MDVYTNNNFPEIFKVISCCKSKELYSEVIESAVRYSQLRVKWYLSEPEDRIEFDSSRRIAHDSFIGSCDILARNMNLNGENYSWRYLLGNDRKTIGDFACYVNFVMGINAR